MWQPPFVARARCTEDVPTDTTSKPILVITSLI
jgi:hypothetical protein